MVAQWAVVPLCEDEVTVAVNAAMPLVSGPDRDAIGLVLVPSESGIEFGKPLSPSVRRDCGLPAQCRNFELKHASTEERRLPRRHAGQH